MRYMSTNATEGVNKSLTENVGYELKRDTCRETIVGDQSKIKLIEFSPKLKAKIDKKKVDVSKIKIQKMKT